jgi:hypothetical protein
MTEDNRTAPRKSDNGDEHESSASAAQERTNTVERINPQQSSEPAMFRDNDSSDAHRHETSTDSNPDATHLLDRRDYLKLTGAAAVAGVSATSTAAAADYRTVTLSEGEKKKINLSDNDTLENVLFEVGANDTKLEIHAEGSGWAIRNIGVKGRFNGAPPDDSAEVISVNVSEGGTGLIENVYLGDGSTAEEAVVGIFVALKHAGTVTIRRVYLRHWPGNGVYGAPPGRSAPSDGGGGGGDVHIEQCYARNNNLSNFRVGTDGSYVRDSVVHVDDDVPYGYSTPGKVNSRGIWVKEGGHSTIENCDILLEHPDASYCVVEYDNEEEGLARVSNCELKARNGADGLYRPDGNYTKNNIGNDPDVAVPTGVPQSAKAAANGGTNNGGGGGGGGDDLPHRITMDGKGPGLTNYSFNVSGDLEPAPPSDGEAGNDVNDGNMTGAVNDGGTDAFNFSGNIGYFNYSKGDILVTVDGHIIDNPETHWE